MDLSSSIKAKNISSNLRTIRDQDISVDTRNEMYEKNYTVYGVRDYYGQVYGYIEREDYKSVKKIRVEDIVTEDSSIERVLRLLRSRKFLFIMKKDGDIDIITEADLTKPEVSLYAFLLLYRFEDIITEIIRDNLSLKEIRDNMYYPRYEEARRLYNKKKDENMDLDLVQCLYLLDKTNILLNVYSYEILGFESEKDYRAFFQDVNRDIRNEVAHTRDIVSGGNKEETIDMLLKLKEITRSLKNFEILKNVEYR